MRGSSSNSFRRSTGTYHTSSSTYLPNQSNFLMSTTNPGSAASNSSSSNQRGRCMELLQTTPLVTLLITLLCLIIYISDNLGEFNQNLQDFSMVPYLVIYEGQWYRIITCAFTHGGLLHIGFNMMSLFGLGQSLESLFGSLLLFFLLLIYVIGCGLLYILMSVFLSWVWNPRSLFQGAVGFSGVLFAMAVDETSLSPFPTRSIFGLFNVPTKIYPWVLMIILQIVIPGVSFLGHLAGIIIGMIHVHKGLNWCLPSFASLRKLEQSRYLSYIVRTRMYKLVPNNEILIENSSSLRSTLGIFGSWLQMVFAPITQCIGRYIPTSISARFSNLTSSSTTTTTNAGPTSTSNVSRSSRIIDNNGRLTQTNNQAIAPQLPVTNNINNPSMIEEATNIHPTKDISSPLQPGRIEANGESKNTTLSTIANTLGVHASGNSFGYDRLQSTEEEIIEEQIIVNTAEENIIANNSQTTSNSNSTNNTNSNLTPEQIQLRAEVRAKALAAAEARAAAAKNVGKTPNSPRS